jgi:hypothetical protein
MSGMFAGSDNPIVTTGTNANNIVVVEGARQ